MPSDGTGFLVAFTNSSGTDWDISAIRLDASGDLVGSVLRMPVPPGDQVDSNVGWNGSSYWVAWVNASYQGVLKGVRVDTSGTLLDSSPVSVLDETPRTAVTLGDGAGDVLVLGTINGSMAARRMGADGNAVDASPFFVAGAANREEQPRIAFGNGLYLVVWDDYRHAETTDRDIWGALVRADGTPISPAGIEICSANAAQRVTDVAFDGTNFRRVG